MVVGETLFERVVREGIITEREEAEYGSLPAFYASWERDLDQRQEA